LYFIYSAPPAGAPVNQVKNAGMPRRYLLLVCNDRDWRDTTRLAFSERAGEALTRARAVLLREGSRLDVDENDVPPGTLWENDDAETRPYASPRYMYVYADASAEPDFDRFLGVLDEQAERLQVGFEQLGTGTWSFVENRWVHHSWPMQ
jgi:hypothetical protein